MESVLLRYIEKKQISQLIGFHKYLRDTKETVSKYISTALKRFPLTSKMRLTSIETNYKSRFPFTVY